MTSVSHIRTVLSSITNDYGVTLVHAVEGGSRVWGFPSPDSDWDVRFIYKRPLSWYLSVRERRDVIELPTKFLPLDIQGWDLKKACQLLMKSNPPLIEWLRSPDVYETTGDAHRLAKLAGRYFNPRSSIYHYLHMAVGNYREYLKGDEVRLKKYLYVLRPLLCCRWIFLHNSFPPVVFGDLVASIAGDINFPSIEVNELLHRKMTTPELGTGPRIDAINTWCAEAIDKYSDLARTTTKLEVVGDDLDELFMEMVTS